MADRPILFSVPMICALLAGRKTQTRRALNPQPDELREKQIPKQLRVNIGDRLWVREAWRCNGWATDLATIFYAASQGDSYTAMCEQYPVADKKPLRVTAGWRPSIHMPRWASRLTLIVTDVRVQQLHDISEEDATAEGCFKGKATGRVFANIAAMHLGGDEWRNARDWYADLWDTINGPDAWEANPWVVAYTFEVERTNIDQLARAA